MKDLKLEKQTNQLLKSTKLFPKKQKPSLYARKYPLYVSNKDRALAKEKKQSTGITLITQNKKERLIEAYQETRGNVTDACRSVGIARKTFYNWVEKDLVFAQAIIESNEDLRFEVRSALVQKIAEGNIAAIIFWLKCRDPEFQESKTAFGVQFDKTGIKIVVTRGE